MRLKSNNVCCAFAWSPEKLGTPAMIASASYIGSMSDDFDNEAHLEIRLVDVTQTDETEMPVIGSVLLPDMACRLDWSSHMGEQGIIAVSCNNGGVYIYSAAAILRLGAKGHEQSPAQQQGQPRAASPALLWSILEHHSPVRCCQFNPSEPQFLATGDDSGQWWLWSCPDAASVASGSRAGPKNVQVIKNAAHNAAVVDIQWHPKYAHIIATAAASGQVNVWNLKTVSLVTSLNVSKASRGAGATCIAWNPTAATQLAVGLDEKHPVVQMWDLKRSVAPIHEMVGHASGVSGLSWNARDTTMLASCGGDGLTIWWDTGSGQKLGQLAPETNYMVDVKWCPVLPAVLATSSFEPLLCVSTAQDMSAFKGDTDGSAAAPPKWMLRPCGASINLALDVVSLAAGTTNELCLTHVGSTSSTNRSLDRQELAQCPPGSPERVKWLQQHHHDLLAAVTKSRTDRQPILEFLSQDTQKSDDALKRSQTRDEDDPFAQITQEHQKSYEDRASEHVAMGQIEEAVDVCLDNGQYADAFALAFLRGGGLIAKVHQRYVEYTTERLPTRRHVLLAGAVASGDFSSLLSGEIEMSWQEALSTIIAYIGEGFADACNRLGDGLKEKKNYEGAYACYVCGRNVDGAVELSRLQGVPPSKVVRDTILLEETTQRGALSPYFAECLYRCGAELIMDSRIGEAAEYLQRATLIGNTNAALLVDRLKYLIPLQQSDKTVPPYRFEPIPDQPTEACRQYFASLQENSLAVPQQQQPQRPPSLSGTKTQPFTAAPDPQYSGQWANPNASVPPPIPPRQQSQPPMAPGQAPGSQYSGQWANPNASVPPPLPPQQQSQPPMAPGQAPGSQYSGQWANPNASVPPPLPPQQQSQPPMAPGQAPGSQYSGQWANPNASVPPPIPPRQQSQPPMAPGQAPGSQYSGQWANPNASVPPPLPPQQQSQPPMAPGQAPGSQYSGQWTNPNASVPPPPPQQQQQLLQPSMVQPPGPGVPSGVVPSSASRPPPPGGVPSPFVPPPQPRGTAQQPISAYSSLRPPGREGGSSAAPPGMPPPPPPSHGMPYSADKLNPAIPTAPVPSQTMPPPPPSSSGAAPAGVRRQAPFVLAASSMERTPAPPPGADAMPPYGQPQLRPSASMPPPSTPALSAPTGSVLEVNSGVLANPTHQKVIGQLQKLIPHISDPRQRASVDHAAIQLFTQLQANLLPDDLVRKLSNYIELAGTPSARSLWREISDSYYNLIQPFFNLRFL